MMRMYYAKLKKLYLWLFIGFSLPLSAQDVVVEPVDSLWTYAHILEGLDSAGIRDMKVNVDGNVYAFGFFKEYFVHREVIEVEGEEQTIKTDSTRSNLFISSYNKCGDLLWQRALGGKKLLVDDLEAGYQIARDRKGNFYITGALISSDSTFTKKQKVVSVPSIGKKDAFVARLNKSGNLSWIRQLGSTGDDFGYGLAVDSKGNVVVTGYSTGQEFTVGYNSDSTLTTYFEGDQNAFAVKFNSKGLPVWVTGIGGVNSQVYGKYVEMSENGQVFIGGDFKGEVSLNEELFVSEGVTDVFFAELSSAGSVQSFHKYGNGGEEKLNTFKLLPTGEILLGGVEKEKKAERSDFEKKSNQDGFLYKVSSRGEVFWQKVFGGNNYQSVHDVDIHLDNRIYVCGIFDKTIQLEGRKVHAQNSQDIFMMGLSLEGELLWSNTAKNASMVTPVRMVPSHDMSFWVGGSMSGTMAFDTLEVVGQGKSSAFKARIGVPLARDMTIIARVWDDKNANGMLDDKKANVKGISVSVIDVETNTVLVKDVTKPNGLVVIKKMPVDKELRLHFQIPEGYRFTYMDKDGVPETKDSDAFEDGYTAPFMSEIPCEKVTLYSAGVWKPGEVHTQVWDDRNGNGIQEDEENDIGVAGFRVHLLEEDNTPVIDPSTQKEVEALTDDGGLAILPYVPADRKVKLKFDLLRDHRFTLFKVAEALEDEDSDVMINTHFTRSFEVDRGSHIINSIKAGVFSPGMIRTKIWYDRNHNGKQEINERAMDNVGVEVLEMDNSVLYQTKSDEDGWVEIDGIPTDRQVRLRFAAPKKFYFTRKDVFGVPEDKDNDADIDGFLPTIQLSRGAELIQGWDAGMYTDEMVVFPIPASDIINILYYDTIRIYDMLGQVMYEGEDVQVDVSSWASGVYLVVGTVDYKKIMVLP